MGRTEPRHPTLRSLYWREEIIEIVLWLRGEGFDERLDAGVLANFLDIDVEVGAGHLDRLVTQGYLERGADGRCILSPAGEQEGRRLTGGLRSVPAPVLGSCGPECWCTTSPIEAAWCAGNRVH